MNYRTKIFLDFLKDGQQVDYRTITFGFDHIDLSVNRKEAIKLAKEAIKNPFKYIENNISLIKKNNLEIKNLFSKLGVFLIG